MSIAQEPKQRKPYHGKAQTYAARRELDRTRRVCRQPLLRTRRARRRLFHWRCAVVRTYRAYRTLYSAQRAVTLTLARWQPTQPGHRPLCRSSIRQWHRRVTRHGWGALRPRSTRPHTLRPTVPTHLELLICALRQLFGWGGARLSAELVRRGWRYVSPPTIYKIFARRGLPVARYALRGYRDGIAYTRYERRRPNAQWHIDFKQIRVADGTPVSIAVILDDYSRYVVAAAAALARSSAWVTTLTQETMRQVGTPTEMVSDNGREFVATWEGSQTAFGRMLAEHGIRHRTCAPHYPQGNGKVEAFNRTLTRELLSGRSFADLAEVQGAVAEYVRYYNNYRLHSALGWRAPVERYAGQQVRVQGVAALPQPVRLPDYYLGAVPAGCDPPVALTPQTAQRAQALVRWVPPGTAPAGDQCHNVW